MTVAELIEKLKEMPQDVEVHVWGSQIQIGTVEIIEIYNSTQGEPFIMLECE